MKYVKLYFILLLKKNMTKSYDDSRNFIFTRNLFVLKTENDNEINSTAQLNDTIMKGKKKTLNQ